MFINNSSLFLIKKLQIQKTNKKLVKNMKNTDLFFILKLHKKKIKINKNKKIFKKDFFFNIFLKFFLINRKNKFQLYRNLIFFKFTSLFSQLKLSYLRLYFFKNKNKINRINLTEKMLKKIKTKKTQLNSTQLLLLIKKNNLNYKKRFKNKKLNFRRMSVSARFFFLKRKKKLYKQKEFFFIKSNRLNDKYSSWNFLLKKKNYFKDFFFFPFYRFKKIKFINHNAIRKKISFLYDFFSFHLFNNLFLNEKLKVFFLLKKKNSFLLNFFNVCNLFSFKNFFFKKNSFLKKKNSFLKKKNSFLKKKNSFFLFFSVISAFPYYFKIFKFFENQIKTKNLFFFFWSSFFKKNFRSLKSSSLLDRFNMYSSIYFFKKLFFNMLFKKNFFFNYNSTQYPIFRLINTKQASKIFFFFFKRKKIELKKKKKFFYFNFWKKFSTNSLKKKNSNFFFKNNLSLLSFKFNHLFNFISLPSTFFHDIYFFFFNPFYFKSYNFFFFNVFVNTSFLSWYSLLIKKNYTKIFTNLLTDSSLFTFAISRQITQTLEYQKLKSFFAYLPYNTLIKFIEYATGKKVALKINPFIFRNLSLNDNTRCFTWAQRVKVFRKNLGPRLFLLESLQIITLSFRLQDPYILSNWMLSMLYKISFWKYKMLLRYLQYILRNFFWSYFPEYKIKGLKFQLKGKVSVAGNARTRTVFTQIGSLSHSTARYKVLTNLNLLRTFTGVIGFRTWLVF